MPAVAAAVAIVADYSIRLRILKVRFAARVYDRVRRCRLLDPIADTERCRIGPDRDGRPAVADYSIRLRILKELMLSTMLRVTVGCRLLDPIADTESEHFDIAEQE